MQAIDAIGIILVIGIIGYGIYKIFVKKTSGCSCGSKNKTCSKPNHYKANKK